FVGFRRASPLNFHDTFLQTAITHGDAQRHPNQFPIGEHDAGARIAIVEDDVDTSSLQLRIELIRRVAYGFTLVITHGADHNLEWCDRARPDDAAFIVILFDRSGGYPADAETVATHLKHGRFPIRIDTSCIQGARVFVTQEEDMAHFDAALDTQLAASRVRVALRDVAQVVNRRVGKVTTPVDTGVVITLFVRATDEIVHVRDSEVGDHVDGLAGIHGAQIPGYAAEVVDDLFFSGEAVAILKAGKLGNLDLIELVIATQQEQPDLHRAFVADRIGGQHDGLDGVGERPAKLFRHQFAFGCLGRGNFL